MDAETSQAGAAASKRGVRRSRVLLAATIRTKLGDYEARLRDLSRKGALIECGQYLDVGEEVVFARGATSVPARVAWTGGDRVGLEFLHPIEEGEVLVQLGRSSAGRARQRSRRPPANSDVLTDRERKLARLWGLAVGLPVPGE